MSGVSVTVTACDRLDLLERTIRSFVKYNTWPIENFLIRDDSGLMDVWEQTSELMKLVPYKWSLLPIGQVGQAKSIDLMIEKVKTHYVFHLEDDWEFDRPGFIEDCLGVMSLGVAQVRVRHRDDGSAAQTKPYHLEDVDECTNHLFSFNPHLRWAQAITNFEYLNETKLGEIVVERGLHTLWLKEGACRHIGGEKTTNRAGTPYAAGVKKA